MSTALIRRPDWSSPDLGPGFTWKSTEGGGGEALGPDFSGIRYELNPRMDHQGQYTGTFNLVYFSPDSRKPPAGGRRHSEELGRGILWDVSRMRALDKLAQLTQEGPMDRMALPGRTRGKPTSGPRRSESLPSPREAQDAAAIVEQRGHSVSEYVRGGDLSGATAGELRALIRAAKKLSGGHVERCGCSNPVERCGHGSYPPELAAEAAVETLPAGPRKPWITRPGKLGGKGFLARPQSERRRILDNCVRRYGYRSCLGSLQVLERNQAIAKAHSAEIDSDIVYLKRKYGGPGSFGPQRMRSTTERMAVTWLPQEPGSNLTWGFDGSDLYAVENVGSGDHSVIGPDGGSLGSRPSLSQAKALASRGARRRTSQKSSGGKYTLDLAKKEGVLVEAKAFRGPVVRGWSKTTPFGFPDEFRGTYVSRQSKARGEAPELEVVYAGIDDDGDRFRSQTYTRPGTRAAVEHAIRQAVRLGREDDVEESENYPVAAIRYTLDDADREGVLVNSDAHLYGGERALGVHPFGKPGGLRGSYALYRVGGRRLRGVYAALDSDGKPLSGEIHPLSTRAETVLSEVKFDMAFHREQQERQRAEELEEEAVHIERMASPRAGLRTQQRAGAAPHELGQARRFLGKYGEKGLRGMAASAKGYAEGRMKYRVDKANPQGLALPLRYEDARDIVDRGLLDILKGELRGAGVPSQVTIDAEPAEGWTRLVVQGHYPEGDVVLIERADTDAPFVSDRTQARWRQIMEYALFLPFFVREAGLDWKDGRFSHVTGGGVRLTWDLSDKRSAVRRSPAERMAAAQKPAIGWNQTQGGSTRGYAEDVGWYDVRKSVVRGVTYFTVYGPGGAEVASKGTLGLAKKAAEQDAHLRLRGIAEGSVERMAEGSVVFGLSERRRIDPDDRDLVGRHAADYAAGRRVGTRFSARGSSGTQRRYRIEEGNVVREEDLPARRYTWADGLLP